MNTPREQQVNPWIVGIVVCVATFMEVLDTTITNVALSHIAGTLGASQNESTWVLTSYLVSNGIVLPLSGWLSNSIGRKRYFLMCIAGFTLSSFACGAASSLGMLVLFRLFQGLAGGGLQPTQQAIMLDVFPAEMRGSAFAIAGITIIVAPIVGPALGGWITDNFNWRWIFFINIPVGVITYFLVTKVVPDSEDAKTKSSFNIDKIGLGLVALGLGTLQIVLDKGEIEDWFDSDFIVSFAVVSLVSLLCAVFWLLKQEDPVIDLLLLKERSFGLPCILMFCTGFILYGSTALIPFLVQTQFGYNATLAGMVISPGGLAVIMLMPLSGKLISKVQAKYLIIAGFTLCALGAFNSMHLNSNISYNTFVWIRITQVIGIPFLFVPLSTLAFSKIPKNKNNKASALFALARNLGGSVGIAITATYTSRHVQIQQSYLAEHILPSDGVFQLYLQKWTAIAIAHGVPGISAGNLALYKLYEELFHQATLLAYRDTFWLLSIIALTSLGIATLLPKNR